MIVDGVTGFLVAPDDIQAAADSVRQGDPDLACGMPRSCRTASRPGTEPGCSRAALPASQPPRQPELKSHDDPEHWLARAGRGGHGRQPGNRSCHRRGPCRAPGAHVVLAARDRDALAGVASSIEAAGGVATPGTHRREQGRRRRAAVCHRRARSAVLAALVCAAGVLTSAPFAETTWDIWDETLGINLTGSFLCCRAAFTAMRAAGEGRIVNIASLSGVYATEKFPGLAAYNVSKYGVIGLTEAIAVEGRPHGISAICVSPGAVDTQMLRRANPELRPGPDTRRCRRTDPRAARQPAGSGQRREHPAVLQRLGGLAEQPGPSHSMSLSPTTTGPPARRRAVREEAGPGRPPGAQLPPSRRRGPVPGHRRGRTRRRPAPRR